MAAGWRIAPGERIYAIGDIHGCAELFAELLSLIRRDNAARPPATTRIVVLGDVIDHGPDSAALVGRLMRYTRSSERFIVLKGNHEEAMLAALEGNMGAAKMWMRSGGGATLASWGVTPDMLASDSLPAIMQEARRAIPRQVVAWMEARELTYRSGDLVFVHAGIKPGTPLHKQKAADLLWIREGFLDDDTAHPVLVVHGHSISEEGPDIRANRIGLDTGAYRTGRLTAVGFEADASWFLAAVGEPAIKHEARIVRVD